MESLCTLKDIEKSTMNVANTISRCVLFRENEDKYGKIHDLIFYLVQKRSMPDEDVILADTMADDDSCDKTQSVFDFVVICSMPSSM
jgi:hypothetical protein